jgi:hypothetical protein
VLQAARGHALTRALIAPAPNAAQNMECRCACRRHQRCQCRKRRHRYITAFFRQLSDEPLLVRIFLHGVSHAKHNRVSRNKRSAPFLPSGCAPTRRCRTECGGSFCSPGCSTSGQRIFDALVQPANCVAAESLISDFQLGRHEKFGWQFLDREPDCVRRAGKTSVSDGLPRLPVPDGG